MRLLLNILNLRKREFIIFLFTLSVIKCVLLYFILEVIVTPQREIGYLPDSRMYETLAKNIISGHGFSANTKEPFTPLMLKEPVYPLFIAMIYLIFGANHHNVIISQILLNPSIAILIYLIGRQIFEGKKARLASLLVCITPLFGEISFFIMAETLYITLMLLFIYMMVSAFKRNRLSFYLFSGALLGICVLCRVVLMYFYGLVIVLIAFGYGEKLQFWKNKNFKQRILKITVFSLCFLLLVTPWIIRNGKIFGIYQVTTKAGLTMWIRGTIAETFTPDNFKAYFLFMLSGRLAQKKFPEFIGEDLGNFEFRFANNIYIQELEKKGFSEGQIDAILSKEGIRKTLRHPFKVILFSSIGYIQVFKPFVPWSIWFYNSDNKMLNELVFPIIRFLFGFPLGILYSFMTILGIYFSRRKINRYLFIIMLIGYYHFMLYFITASPGGVQRFILPIIPIYSFFVSISIIKICKIPDFARNDMI